ncbi:MAG TPA: 2,3,4,5-tetrahydropyridine-2,6-dicarboxylate N-succinyltransferase, partial [Acidimicrobiales bacterium]|nr:2,3,4,5-tetrahydropyridine-2,6-dicarboxylate N-succinyltransferase [Acidimicrobiales bacterium]
MTTTDDTRRAWGRGWATLASDGTLLDAWYPELGLGAPPAAAQGSEEPPPPDPVRATTTAAVEREVDLDAAPADAADAYLRLHLLSARLVAPRTINLDGVFGTLP